MYVFFFQTKAERSSLTCYVLHKILNATEYIISIGVCNLINLLKEGNFNLYCIQIHQIFLDNKQLKRKMYLDYVA